MVVLKFLQFFRIGRVFTSGGDSFLGLATLSSILYVSSIENTIFLHNQGFKQKFTNPQERVN